MLVSVDRRAPDRLALTRARVASGAGLIERLSPSPSLSGAARAYALAKVVRARLVIAPVMGTIALTFAFFEPTSWRRITLVAAVSLLFGLSVIEFLRARRYGLGAVLLPLNLLLMVLGQLLVTIATGGLFSPAIPIVLLMVVLAGLLADRATVLRLIALIAPVLWILAALHLRATADASLVPRLFGRALELERGPAPLIAASVFTLMLGATAVAGTGLQRLFEALHRDGIRERDQALALHAEQSRVITVLVGEIAHELKNPLASVKGLAALLAKDVRGRAAERLAVLRREVDRMQTILDEFLNFSRPLVPLSLCEVDLAELARDVVRLHEGTALEQRVTLEVRAEKGARLRCDLRKIRQVLINLLQNAIEASPPEATVVVRVLRAGERLAVRVEDEGAGVSEALASRVFEPGVTSKEQGSGLGLVVARALARQHGGEVTLGPGAQGGAVAELSLPSAPPEATP